MRYNNDNGFAKLDNEDLGSDPAHGFEVGLYQAYQGASQDRALHGVHGSVKTLQLWQLRTHYVNGVKGVPRFQVRVYPAGVGATTLRRPPGGHPAK